MKKIILLIFVLLIGCETTTEQPCKWLIDEKTQEYYEVCK